MSYMALPLYISPWRQTTNMFSRITLAYNKIQMDLVRGPYSVVGGTHICTQDDSILRTESLADAITLPKKDSKTNVKYKAETRIFSISWSHSFSRSSAA